MSLPIYEVKSAYKKPYNALLLKLGQTPSDQLYIDVKGPPRVIQTILEYMKVTGKFLAFRIRAEQAPLLFSAIYHGQFKNTESFVPIELLHKTALPLIQKGYLSTHSEDYACIRVGSGLIELPISSRL